MTTFIERLHVTSYGCINDASFELSPIHALIGPNDSGKSTVLRALRTLVQFGAGQFQHGQSGWRPFDPVISSFPGARLTATFRGLGSYGLEFSRNGLSESVCDSAGGEILRTKNGRAWNVAGILRSVGPGDPHAPELQALAGAVRVPRLLRLDPDALRSASPLLLEGAPIDFADERGTGLPSIYDAFINRDFKAFAQTQQRVQDLFPTVAQIGLRNVPGPNNQIWKALDASLVTGERVPSSMLSEGLLYFLAFAAIQYMDPTSLLLIEEPENGLHPSRIADVMRILREVSKTTQIVLATHSPLVINEMQGHEVTVVTRTLDQGTRATLLSKVPGFADAAKVYLPGEFWVSYADGNVEQPLLTGRPRA